MWVKIKDDENKTEAKYINIDRITSMEKVHCYDNQYALYIYYVYNHAPVSIYRTTEAEIDKIIQALIGEETIKEVE